MPELTLSELAARLGRKGGQSTSEAKRAAVRRNGRLGGRKPKPVVRLPTDLCADCQADLMTTDYEAGFCTQCGKKLTKSD